MKSYRYFHLDVFTAQRFAGNQLAVFLDARNLPAPLMQTIANEMNFPETVFVLPAQAAGADARLRIFTPAEELPIAGHPTVGAAFALARAGLILPDGDRVLLELGIGPTPLSLIWRGGDLSFVWMTQPLPVFSPPIENVEGAAAALQVPAADVARTGLPVQVVSCGNPFLMVPLATRAAVDSARLDAAAYDRFRQAAGIEPLPVFLFSTQAVGDANPPETAYSRMFAPGFGIPEDPATGSASGPLGCYLVRHKVVTERNAGSMLGVQGVRMGRPSHIHISIGLEDGDIVSVRVGGEAVVAGEGILYL